MAMCIYHDAADNNCFTQRNSAVLVSALDASIALDNVRHEKLFFKLSSL